MIHCDFSSDLSPAVYEPDTNPELEKFHTEYHWFLQLCHHFEVQFGLNWSNDAISSRHKFGEAVRSTSLML